MQQTLDQKFEKLKTTLFNRGIEAIEDFLNYKIQDINESKDTTENRLNQAYIQMPNEELQKFFKKWNI